MALSNHERVGKALDLLKDGLAPFVERQFQSLFGKNAHFPRVRVLMTIAANPGATRLVPPCASC